MADAFAAAAEIIAADPNMGADAVYTPTGEAALSVRVVLSRTEGDIGIGGAIAAGWEAMLPAADVPDRPRKGEALSVGDRDFVVESAERDETGASWRLTLGKRGTWA